MREPLFVVSPPRSYTSVIGGMLGQHPQAYGLPELNLALGDCIGDRWNSLLVEVTSAGLLRLLAELHEGNQSEDAVVWARKWLLQRPHWTHQQLFYHIQDCVGHDRMLVEKSPHNTFRAENLERLVRFFPRANFLHLTRHPRTQGRSSLDLRDSYGGSGNDLDPEKIWYLSHNNILDMAASLPPAQYMQIKGEDLLSDPATYLPQICEWLDLDRSEASIQAMMHPEASPFASLGPKSALLGNDPNFLENPKLDLDRLARIREPALEGPVDWKVDGAGFALGTARMARRFGYA